MTTSPAPQPADGERDLMAALQKSLGLPPRPTTPASAEPTEVPQPTSTEREYAADVTTDLFGCDLVSYADQPDVMELIAFALASQRAEIVARYEKVAVALQEDSYKEGHRWGSGWANGRWAAAVAIREAAPK